MERKGEQRRIHSEHKKRGGEGHRGREHIVSTRVCVVSERIEYVPDTFKMAGFTALLHRKK